MKKKRIICFSAAVVFLLMGTLVVYAFLTSNNDRINTVKVGGNTVSINETDKELPDDNNPQTKTKEYKKPIKIDNTGDISCYIRVRLDFSDDTVRKLTSFSVSDPVDFVSVADNYDKYCEKLTNWEYHNGYFYYTKPVKAKESTTYLLKTVKTNYGNAEIQAYDIYVYAESVQTIGNDGNEVGYAEAWKQFLGESIYD